MERLKSLGLPTLKYSRESADMIQIYKILHDIDKADREKIFQMTPYTQTIKRAPSEIIKKKRCLLNLKGDYLSQRVIDQRNGLPINLLATLSLNASKRPLNRSLSNSEQPATSRRTNPDRKNNNEKHP